MNIHDLLISHPELTRNNLWMKIISKVHIQNKNTTYCGRPILGDNHINIASREDVCNNCLSMYELEQKSVTPKTK